MNEEDDMATNDPAELAADAAAAPKMVYEYVGEGAFLPEVPARDLTDADDLSHADEIEASGLYRKVTT